MTRLESLRHDTSPATIRASIAASEAMAMNGGPEVAWGERQTRDRDRQHVKGVK
jgi:hypothetical protein